jgi:hypothetical protein
MVVVDVVVVLFVRGNGWMAYTFDKSPIMSTYQVTIAVGDFVRIDTDWQNFTSYPVGISLMGSFSLSFGLESQRVFTAIPY